jgi:predicted transcriptional regulator
MGLKEILLRTKPLCIFLQLRDTSKDWYASNLAVGCGATYVHTTKLLKEFKKSNLVTFEPTGRVKKVKLTDRGMQLATAIGELMLKLEEKEEEKKEQKTS